MDGLMMDRPLLVSSLIEHAATYHGDTEIVSRTVEGPIHRTTYAEAERRAKRVANALTRLGIRPGDRVATLAWNGYRHFELYFGISGIGAVCHTSTRGCSTSRSSTSSTTPRTASSSST